MTVSHDVADISSPSTNGFLAYIEYAFYILLIAGVVFMAYQVKTNKWQLLERQPASTSTAEAS